jgi:hypothetical protein
LNRKERRGEEKKEREWLEKGWGKELVRWVRRAVGREGGVKCRSVQERKRKKENKKVKEETE